MIVVMVVLVSGVEVEMEIEDQVFDTGWCGDGGEGGGSCDNAWGGNGGDGGGGGNGEGDDAGGNGCVIGDCDGKGDETVASEEGSGKVGGVESRSGSGEDDGKAGGVTSDTVGGRGVCITGVGEDKVMNGHGTDWWLCLRGCWLWLPCW